MSLLHRFRHKFLFAVLVIMAMPMVSQAQTNTPIPPSATPVALTIPVNEIFSQTNTWMTSLGPVVALGIGISVALAILTFIGKQIISAFRGG